MTNPNIRPVDEQTLVETAAAVAIAPAILPSLAPIAAGVVIGLASWNFLKNVLAEDRISEGNHHRKNTRTAP